MAKAAKATGPKAPADDLARDKRYGFLVQEPGPRMIVEAIKLYGVTETPGSVSNPEIMAWADEVGVARGVYSADSVPWCGLFAAVVARRAGWENQIPATPLWARAWATFGQPADKPSLGDVLVFIRDGGGHVGFYVGEDASAYHVFGGNQGDLVSGRRGDTVGITRIDKTPVSRGGRFLAARAPLWKFGPPPSRRPILLGASGPLSTNEA